MTERGPVSAIWSLRRYLAEGLRRSAENRRQRVTAWLKTEAAAGVPVTLYEGTRLGAGAELSLELAEIEDGIAESLACPTTRKAAVG